MRIFALLAFLPITAFATDFKPEPEPTSIVNAQTQHQGQSQYQEQSQSASQAVTGNGVVTLQDRLQIPYTPAPTAPAIYASNPCAIGESEARTFPIYGRSKGKTTIDGECSFRELVRVTASVDPCLARKLLATHPSIAAVDPAPVVCAPPITSQPVTKEYVDRVVQDAKEEAKRRDDALFRQSQSK